ncbi:MAG: UDP-glucose/GDP-mannose dehydrogenase family protein [Bacteroidetes bacterium]|nr:UDP-glucose/GDP-mannose dehydrogenase family protein [Bacteroidota bacterium]
MNIAVVGTGYVGLVTGTCLAEMGNNVICVDIDEAKINKLNKGVISIYEPDLDILFKRNFEQKRLSFTTDLKSAVSQSLLIFLALPTPTGEDGSADLSYVLDVAGQLGDMIDEYKVIIDKSTVPVGTAAQVTEMIKKNAKAEFDVVSNPEFLREGVAVKDFMKPDRVVIGTSSAKARQIMEKLYAPFLRQGNPLLIMDERSAELTKYAANTYLATRISFMNEIASMCEILGADVDMVRRGIGSDTRIGKSFLFPGVGFGGSCFPKDVQALLTISEKENFDFKILRSVIDVNQRQRILMAVRIQKHFGDNLEGKKIAVWGLAFKPDTDDIREAPSTYMIQELLNQKASISVFDPEAMDNVKNEFGDKINYAKDQYEAIQDADVLLIVTEWALFRTPDFNKMKELMKQALIFDGRNLYNLDDMLSAGFEYYSIGRTPVNKQS